MAKYIIILITYLMAVRANCQQPHHGAWLALQLPVNSGSKWQWHNDAGYRMAVPGLFTRQYLYRTGIRYNISNRLSAAGGGALFYTRTGMEKAAHEFGHEKRLWQELRLEHLFFLQLNMIHRFRAEQRFFDATTRKAAYSAGRYRYRVQLTGAIAKNWGWQVFNEYMRQWQRGRSLFDQNRVQLAVSRRLPGQVQAEAGYMWLLQPGVSQHLIVIGI